jgi:methylated-DNA-[protein]-cysteine S-methyltransferase
MTTTVPRSPVVADALDPAYAGPGGLPVSHDLSPVRAGQLRTVAGPLSVLVADDGVVVAAGFARVDELVVRWAAQGTGAPVRSGAVPSGVASALRDYGDGDLAALARVPVRQHGPAFLRAVWAALAEVPAGETVTYSELAVRAVRPAAVRAAASGCARNLLAPFVPCHRVLRSDGSLGGYAYGVEVKRALLTHERRPA